MEEELQIVLKEYIKDVEDVCRILVKSCLLYTSDAADDV